MLSWFRDYRVSDWIHYLGFPVLALMSCNYFSLELLLVSCAVLSLLLSYAYSMNQFFDESSSKYAVILPLLLLFPFFARMNYYEKIISAIFIFVVTIYSHSSTRLKKYPFAGTLLNCLGFSLLYALPLNSFNSFTLSLLLAVLFYNLSAQLIHELAHARADKLNGITTTAILLGRPATVLLCRLVLMLPPVILFYAGSISVALPALFFSLFIIAQFNSLSAKVLRSLFRKSGVVTGLFFAIGIVFRNLF